MAKAENRDEQRIFPKGIPSAEQFGNITVWLTYNWAPEWLADAHMAAQTTTVAEDRKHSRRREILFAACFAESYLFEWVRDEVLDRDFEALERFLRRVSTEVFVASGGRSPAN